ncbi:MAG: PBP1A family penicillin-binding protein [Lachnospiraceae bacterium]|nr:PBP1A family penicillin-binding protein [Lachnospiraceae bacterium]
MSHTSSRKKRKRRPKKKRRDIGSFFFRLTQFTMLGVLIGVCWLFYQTGYIQTVISLHKEAQAVMEQSSIEDFKANQSGEVYDADGNLIALLRNDKNIVYLTADEIPDQVKNAFVSIEDKRFYKHHGFDPFAILRAAQSLITKNSITQGGSTITQQLARNIYLTHTVKWERKVEEIFIAMALENKYSKEELLEFYINNIYFSNGYYGIQAASRGYLGKDADQLTLSESAFLCAIPNSPGSYDPMTHMDNTLKRRDLILKNMYKDGMITESEYDQALAETIALNPSKPSFTRTWAHPYIYDCATRALMEATGLDYDTCRGQLYTGGYRVYTSINMNTQELLQHSIDEQLSDYNTMNSNGTYALQSSATCIDNATGLVTAIVGGRTQDDILPDYNRAFMSFRQPGSSIKPLVVYAPSLERNYTASSTVMDTKEEDGPANSSDRYAGAISLRTAVEQSKNTVAHKLLRELTPEVGLSYLLDMNFSSIEEEDYNLASALGGFTTGVSSLEMTAGYATLANEGVYRLPTCITMITDMDGNIIVMPERKEHPVYEADAAREMTNILEGVLTRGTARGKGIPDMPCAGKTGTTNDNYDGWFIGYSAYYTTGVWVGFDSPRSNSALSGATYPVAIWQDFMTALHEGLSPMDLKD